MGLLSKKESVCVNGVGKESAGFSRWSDGKTWPKISIVTPSYNQVDYLEETIRSVLGQGYPNLEYIIIDGGSTDGSVEIIQEYSPFLNYWISEPDRGQSQAILKGMARCTGEIMAWINSDDLYTPGAFFAIARAAKKHPEALWFAGRCDTLEGSEVTPGKRLFEGGVEEWYLRNVLMQPGVFWRRSIWLECGGLDENLHYSFDYDLWLQFAARQPLPFWINSKVAIYRSHPATKTATQPERFTVENEQVKEKHAALWKDQIVRAGIVRLMKKKEAYERIEAVATYPQVFSKVRAIFQAIRTYPALLLGPMNYYIILKAFFNFQHKSQL